VDSVWSGGLTGLQTGEVIAAYGRQIKQPDTGETKGFLIAAFAPSDLSAAVQPFLEKDANLLLIDQNGQVVFSAREPDLKPEQQYLTDSPLVRPALDGEAYQFSSTKTGFDGDLTGERYGSMLPIPTMKWVIGYTRSQAALDSSLRSSLLRDIGIAGLFVVLSMGGLLLLSRAITRPLRRLSVAATEVAMGRESVLPRPGTITDPDVARLESAFSTMALEVRDREARLVDQARTLGTLEQMGAWIASGLDFEKTLQAVTDAGTRVTEAQFGAFFYNVTDDKGESYQLYTLSGVDRSHFENFPMPRNTDVFGATFSGGPPVRSDDIQKDPRFGHNSPYFGMPEGHLPVHSYLAVPVSSGTGETIGGLFFGHERVGVFGERHERLAAGIASWAGIALDNARLYSQSQDIQEELRKSNQSKDEFLGVISHELRTPVTTIYGGLRLLEGRFEQISSEDALDLIGSMAEEGARLVRLIENLLAFARLELGRPIDTQPVAIVPLVRHVVESFNRLRPDRVIEADINDDLPPLVLEPTYFEQVLQNLISNADKYSPADQPIHVTVKEAENELQVVVDDHGSGVAEEELDQIFEGFYRSDRTAAQAAGHGLGLTVCKRLVETQGGRIWARNLERGGLEVGFAFPTVPIEELVS
jgi:signal transduction histidine kinase